MIVHAVFVVVFISTQQIEGKVFSSLFFTLTLKIMVKNLFQD